jgi:hypothetical protein
MRVDSALEIAIPGQDRADDEISVPHGLADVFGQRAGVANAGRAAVPDQVKAERFEVS